MAPHLLAPLVLAFVGGPLTMPRGDLSLVAPAPVPFVPSVPFTTVRVSLCCSSRLRALSQSPPHADKYGGLAAHLA